MLYFPALTVEDVNPNDASVTAAAPSRSTAITDPRLPAPPKLPPVVYDPRIVLRNVDPLVIPRIGVRETPDRLPFPAFNPGAVANVNNGGVTVNPTPDNGGTVTDARQTPTPLVSSDGLRVPASTHPVVQTAPQSNPLAAVVVGASRLTRTEVIALAILAALVIL